MSYSTLFEKAMKITNSKNLIHVGAHVGQEILLYKKYNFNNVYLVEPIENSFKILQNKIKNYKNFKAYNCALGSKEANAIINIADGLDEGSSSLLTPRKSNISFSSTQDVKIRTFKSLNLKNVDAAVIDTQGYELEVLKGFGAEISNLNFGIVEFSNYEGYINQPTYNKLYKFMLGKGFIFFEQHKQVNNPFPSKNGGSYGDALFINKKYLSSFKVLRLRLKWKLINNIFYDLNLYFFRNIKRIINRVLK